MQFFQIDHYKMYFVAIVVLFVQDGTQKFGSILMKFFFFGVEVDGGEKSLNPKFDEVEIVFQPTSPPTHQPTSPPAPS